MTDGLTSLPVGSLLRERYVIKSVLGSGNAGTVYLVKDQQVKRLKYNVFALKEIIGLDQQARYQFTFNGVALRHIQHPALPLIHHVFNDDKHDRVYLVMDYIEGTHVENLRRQSLIGRFPWFELQKLFEPIFGAITYLHQQEKPLFHGDVKPTNIIQSITGKMMLVDIGYAQAITSELLKQQTPGIFSSYRAPEYFAGRIDKAADIYGLAATLYTLLTGQIPMSAPARMKSLVKRKPDPLPSASALVEGIPEHLAQALQRGLAIDPDARFSSVEEFWQALNTTPNKPLEYPQMRVVDSTIEPASSRARSLEDSPVAEKETPPSNDRRRFVPSLQNVVRRSSLLPKIAILCGILLLLLAVATWAFANHQAALPGSAHSSPTATQTNSASQGSSATPGRGGHYPDVLGSYAGMLTPLGSPGSIFTLFIQHQNGSQISGTFSSPQQEGNFTGTIDTAGNLQFIVANDAGDAVLSFSGGLNGDINLLDSMGGTFSSCAPKNGAVCVSSTSLSGTWSLNHQSTPHPSSRGSHQGTSHAG